MEAAVAVMEPEMEAEPAQEPKTEAAVAVEQTLALVEEPMMPIRKARQVAAELISVLRTMLLAEMTVEAEQALALVEEPMMPIRKAQQVEAEPALALVEEPMMPIRKVQQVTAVNPTEVLAARPQRMAPILHRHLPER